VISYLRKSKDGTVLVVLNFSGKPQSATFDLSKQGFPGAKVKGLLQNAANVPDGALQNVKLDAYGAYIGRVTQ